MLYTLCILLTGIYLGQEYDIIPSIRILINSTLLYLRTLRDPTMLTYYERFKKLIKW